MRIICAVCRREKGPDGRYRPTVRTITRGELVSHGYCGPCKRAVIAICDSMPDRRPRTPGPACQREMEHA